MFFLVPKQQCIKAACVALICILIAATEIYKSKTTDTVNEGEFIKWMDFNASYEALNDTFDADVKSEGEYNWIELLSYLAVKNGNNFSRYRKKDLADLICRLENGERMDTITNDMKYYDYYMETFSAVLSEYVGRYYIQTKNVVDEDEPLWEERYGLKVFCPIAAGYSFEHYDDFGNSRSYGYRRRHTGHDLFGSIGTPIVAIEGGTVEHIGWNKYGGWRIGIRSFDKKRYYYYAHMRKDKPYAENLSEGSVVKAGDHIGFLGMTGYSNNENVNNINVPHLHVGVQVIFDESQVEGNKEIWIDAYQLVKFLRKNCSAIVREDNEYVRKYKVYQP